jgi:integrase
MTGKIMPLRERDTSTIRAAADAFLSSPRYANPNTRRGYTGVLDRLLAGLAASRPLAEVSGEELARLLDQLWGRRAPATWNRNRGAVTAWLSWCAANRLPAPVLPASAERRREHLNATRAVPLPAIERALSRRDVPLREKTLWRMLYETAARASEVLALNIEDLELDARRAPVRSKGGDTEWICWVLAPRTCCPALPAAAKPDRYSSPSAALALPAAPRPRTCVLSPDGPGSAMTAPGSCSPGARGGSCTSYATLQRPTSASKASRCS